MSDDVQEVAVGVPEAIKPLRLMAIRRRKRNIKGRSNRKKQHREKDKL